MQLLVRLLHPFNPCLKQDSIQFCKYIFLRFYIYCYYKTSKYIHLIREYSVTRKVGTGYRKTEKYLGKDTTDRTAAGKYKQI